ncbi:MAG TPA: S9 family peptidase [Gemmatimonadaceae bacterium]|nr:S9 family peptidase [Gemmatimonadaceae bacterium]
MRLTRTFVSLLLLAPLAAFAQAPPAAPAAQPAASRAFQPNDWHRLTTLAGPAMAPDGRRVAFTVTTVVERENRRHSEVWVVNTAGGDPARWTSPGTESSAPRWSTDGKLLLFTSNRPGGRGNTWALRVDEPGGEAFQPENLPPAGSTPADKGFVVFTATDSADAAGGGGGGGGRGGRGGAPFGAPAAGAPGGPNPMSLVPFGAITKPVDQARFDGRHVVTFPYKSNGPGYLANPRDARPVPRAQQLFTQKLDGASRRVQLTSVKYSHTGPVVSPDGRWIAFIADAQLRSDSLVQALNDSLAKLPFDRRRDAERRNDRDIYVISAAGGEPRKLLTLQGDESNLGWSPDSRRISFVSRPYRTENARLMLVDATGGTPQNLTGNWQYEPAAYQWLPNGNVAMLAQIGGRAAVFAINVRAATMREVMGGRRVIRGASWDEARATFAFVATSVTKPTELFVANADGTGERKLTAFNDKVNAEVAWADAERFTYRSVGDLEIEAWLMKPYGYQPGRKYPLVLYIHGGPHSSYDEGWFDEFQNLAGAGMMVLYTNPRGSSGYGAGFTYITRGQWGGDDYKDLMKAADIVAARPDVDSTRMGLTGGSYGGFMTAWVTTKTNRFKAAEADRMISNWVSWYSVSDAQGLTEWEFYGKPWENPAMYDTLSPIKYVAKVQTPTLIVQSEEDHRTPMPEADQWFMSLKKRGVPVEWVRYPRSTHDLSRTGEPWLLVDRLGRLRQWFAHWLMPETRAKATDTGAR